MEIKEDAVQGRFCVATRHFDVGDVILRCDPLVEMLINPARHCSNCYAPLDCHKKRAECPSCRRFAYCSEACRTAHWDSAHSKECRAVALFDTPYAQSIAAFFIRIVNCGDKWTFLRPSPTYDPATHRMPAAYAAVYETMLQKGAIAAVPPETLGMMFACIYNNSFTIESSSCCSEKVGIAVYLEASLFSHSCVYNASRSFSGKTACFRASRPIEPGDEIVITYTDKLDESLGVRRQVLYDHFGFVCKCERCLLEDKKRGGEDDFYLKARDYKKSIELFERLNDLESLLRYKYLLMETYSCK